MSKTKGYKAQLAELQLGLVRFEQWTAGSGEKALVIFEGRDGAGKDGTIARITAHLAPRRTRVVALPAPSSRDKSEWYFQRYVRHLPAAGEIVLFNRSWYNRAGVEPVMGFCTKREHADFLRDAPVFERMLEEAQIRIIKLWLDISKAEQGRRLDERRSDPLKALKVSELDGLAQKRWDDYSKARNEMLVATHSEWAPWTIVATDDKKTARLNVIRRIIHALAPGHIRRDYKEPDPKVVFDFDASALSDGRLAK